MNKPSPGSGGTEPARADADTGGGAGERTRGKAHDRAGGPGAPGAPGAPGDRVETRLAHAGYDPQAYHGFVNPPVVHASTVLYGSSAEYRAHARRYTYGRTGTPTTEALERLVSDLEGAERTVLAGSGLAAVTLAVLATVKAGDAIIVADNIYGPSRRFCDDVLAGFGVTTRYFDPVDLDAFTRLLDERPPAVVLLEAPGSLTFEVTDIAAFAAAAKTAGAVTIMDNTWATPLYFSPLVHGCDLSVHAGTKYLGGHSDLLLGTIAGNGEAIAAVAKTARFLGNNVGPDDVFMTLRGVRTLAVRLARHQASGIAVARWLEAHPKVDRVLHPALESHPQHAICRRLFCGASGLFSIVFRDRTVEAVDGFIDRLRLYGIGASWGGYESLATHPEVAAIRTNSPWDPRERLVRLHIGLEDPGDLIADLEQALAAMA
jgi:cystathionine beta-lyase